VTSRIELGASRVLRGWEARPPAAGPHGVGALLGEGIGPEVVGAALDVLGALEAARSLRFELRIGPQLGLAGGDDRGHLTGPEADFCHATFAQGGALLCGPRGGRFVYELRRRFELFAKLTPVRPLPALLDAGPVRPQAVRGADLLFVRENVGGLYFGSHRETRDGRFLREAQHSFGYARPTVDRILRLAVELAQGRRGRLALVAKSAGVPAISELWRECAAEVCEAAAVELEVLEVDNACYQVVADARRFDVVVSPNMFGDVLADVAALLLGSRGVSHSLNLGDQRRAVYQTGHGAARDLAGSDRANPVGQILALAGMLETSFGLPALADAVRAGTQAVLAGGWRTPDVMASGCTEVGTRELGKRIADQVHALAAAAESDR
jgi:3-isopropylmalate dehydrogenase